MNTLTLRHSFRLLGLLLLISPLAKAQNATVAPAGAATPPANAAPTDRTRMVALLNIPTPPPPRPAGTSENHDEAKAIRHPNLPDPLKLKNGQIVTTADMWWKQRRPEIYEDLMTEVYGKIPANIPKITWEVTSQSDNGFVKIKNIVGHVDNSSYPEGTPVNLLLTLYTPSKAPGPVPVIVEVSASGPFAAAPPQPLGPTAAETDVLNNAIKKLVEKNDPAITPVLEKYPTFAFVAPSGAPSGASQILAKGWGFAAFDTSSAQPDSGAGLTQGIIGFMNKGQPRSRPDEWGVLAAWSWGLSKAVDYLETDKDVDAKQLAVEGFSRWGKTAVLAAVIEPRWVLSWAGDSGEGGTKIHRRDYGETVDDVAQNFYWWMAGNFQKYAGGHWDEMSTDSHEMVALVAPRAVFITGGTTDQHADSVGMFQAAVGAGPVYQLLGKKDLGTTQMPAADVALISGDLGYRMHTGAHTPAPDWPTFIEFASKYLKAPAAK